ncbi:MAG: 16S rRNA (uracil(1498)-N(3))-methyltransferase [Eubacteriales bacterium]|nr:16S rRNA (uracil(1498)-N(3))-methyltransferase [Eubacteriales bacterium]
MHHIFIKENENIYENLSFIIPKNSENYIHLVKSLRVKINEIVLVSIQKYDYKTKIIKIDDNELVLKIIERSEKNELPIYITLIQGLAKKDKLDIITDNTTELGVSQIIPCEMKNSIVKYEEKKKKNVVERLQKISTQAAMQSRRGFIPIVSDIMNFREALDTVKDYDYKFLFYEEKIGVDETIYFLNKMENNKKCAIIIGPEGGFSNEEIEYAKEVGCSIFSLGKRILRTELASTCILSYIMMMFENKNVY